MARSRQTPEQQVIDVPLPSGGLNIDRSFTQQRKGTTPSSLNIRPFDPLLGRRRVSRRPGQRKYVTTQVAAGPIQALETIVVSQDDTVGTGDVMTIGDAATDDEIKIYNRATGAAQTTTPADVTVAAPHTMACVDEDNAFYVAAATASGTSQLQLTKINSSFERPSQFPVTMTIAGSGYATIAGIAAHNGVIYVWLIAKTAGSITSPGIYRFDASSGARLEGTVWPVTGGVAPDGLVTATTITNAYQAIALGADVLAVCGGKNNKLVLQQINVTTATVVHETDIQSPFESYPCKVIADKGSNFYVLTNINSTGAPTTSAIKKVSHTGAVLQTNTSAYGPKDVAYDPIYFRLGVVGYGASGMTFTGGGINTDSMNILNADTLVRTSSTSPNSQTDWAAIANDGIAGGFRVRRSALNNDLHSLDPIWTISTGSDTTTQKLWVVCSGLNVAPSTNPMQSNRLVRATAICNGGLYTFNTTSVSSLQSNFCSGAAAQVFSAQLNSKIYFVDGSSYPTYDGTTNTAGTLTASAGSLPGTGVGDRCRLICAWNGRLVMAGLFSDPQEWFMSRVDDPTNWNYFPSTPSVIQAIKGALSDAGKAKDIINTLVPYKDDLLIFGCDHSIWQMTGDPADNGTLDNISRTIGMAWGQPWCLDSSGRLYFMSSRGSVYRLAPGGIPDRISVPIDEDLFDVDFSEYRVRMLWEDRFKGLHVIISPLDKSLTTTHYWWDSYTDRSTTFEVLPDGSWWPDQFGNKNLNALAAHVFDGDDPNDRAVILGGRDGYIRVFDVNAESDDGTAITSELFVGPIQLKYGDKFYLTDMQATLSDDSEDLTYTITAGPSAEAAFNGDEQFRPVTLSAGRNHSQPIRVGTHCAFVKLRSTDKALPWSVDNIKVVLLPVVGIAPQRIF